MRHGWHTCARMRADDASDAPPAQYPLNLAPGDGMKYLDSSGMGGSYVLQMMLHVLGADARCVVPGAQLFVAYLRECFRWGGFRGWAKLDQRPEQNLAFLTQELLSL
jgi:hypothetical protein